MNKIIANAWAQDQKKRAEKKDYINNAEKESEYGNNGENNFALDIAIRVMDKLAEMKVLNEEQSADKDFTIQDAIVEEIEIVQGREKSQSYQAYPQTPTIKKTE